MWIVLAGPPGKLVRVPCRAQDFPQQRTCAANLAKAVLNVRHAGEVAYSGSDRGRAILAFTVERHSLGKRPAAFGNSAGMVVMCAEPTHLFEKIRNVSFDWHVVNPRPKAIIIPLPEPGGGGHLQHKIATQQLGKQAGPRICVSVYVDGVPIFAEFGVRHERTSVTKLSEFLFFFGRYLTELRNPRIDETRGIGTVCDCAKPDARQLTQRQTVPCTGISAAPKCNRLARRPGHVVSQAVVAQGTVTFGLYEGDIWYEIVRGEHAA